MSSFNLSLLRDSLPDSDLQLHPQTPVLTNFTKFLNLPPMIRKLIWDMIRGRRILATMDSNGALHTRTPPPITFQICKDSRYATLSAYEVPLAFSGYASTHDVVVKPYNSALHLHFFDAKVDTLILHGRNPSDASCYFQYATSSIAEDLTEIKYLEVKRFDWAMLMFRGWRTWSQGLNPQFTYFRCFRGLKKLTIIGGGHGLRTKQEQEDCKAAFKRVFETFDTMYPDYQIPEVVIKMP